MKKHIKLAAATLAFAGLLVGAVLVEPKAAEAAPPAHVSNKKTVSVVLEYAEILNKYKEIHGEYPNVSAEYACLPTNLPQTKTFGAGVCELQDGKAYGTTTPDGKDFWAMLRTVQSTFPDAGYGQALDGYNEYGMGPSRGIIYTDEGVPHIEYVLHGDVECPLGTNSWGTGLKNTRCSINL